MSVTGDSFKGGSGVLPRPKQSHCRFRRRPKSKGNSPTLTLITRTQIQRINICAREPHPSHALATHRFAGRAYVVVSTAAHKESIDTALPCRLCVRLSLRRKDNHEACPDQHNPPPTIRNRAKKTREQQAQHVGWIGGGWIVLYDKPGGGAEVHQDKIPRYNSFVQ